MCWKWKCLPALLGVVVACGCGSNSSVESPEASAPSSATSSTIDTETFDRYAPDSKTSDHLHPVVKMETSEGTITIRLDAEKAPGTVRNFLEYISTQHYNGTVFHYVDRKSIIIGGGYTTELEPKPTGEPIRNEAHNGLKNRRGTIAMTRNPEDIDSATCQFFINLADNADLNHRSESTEEYGYCVFGEILEGMEVAERIAGAAVDQVGDFPNTPKERILIKTVQLSSADVKTLK